MLTRADPAPATVDASRTDRAGIAPPALAQNGLQTIILFFNPVRF